MKEEVIAGANEMIEIYNEIKDWDECSNNFNPKEKPISVARGFAAEFPSDEKIQEFLADLIFVPAAQKTKVVNLIS